MKPEDQAAIREIRQGKVGEVTSIRYSLHSQEKNKDQIISHAKEALNWISEINEDQHLKDIYASVNSEKTVWLITCKLINNALVNMFLDFSANKNHYIKKTEIAGTSGLFVYDSSIENAFQSNYLSEDKIEPDKVEKGIIEEWWEIIERSIEKGDVMKG